MMSLFRSALAVAVTFALAAPSAMAVEKLTTDKEKQSYMVGMSLGRNLVQIKDKVDLEIVIQALKAQVNGEKLLLTDQEAAEVGQAFGKSLQAEAEMKQKDAAEKNKKEGEAFLAKNKTAPGVKSTPSGLQYLVIKQGTGPKPAATDQVKVNYVGTLISGKKFDSSYDRNEPAKFPLNGVIPGWTEALQLMPVGSKYKLFIPANLAYGDHGPGDIGPNATLIFEVELLEIVK
jgi:FKBP-type peptidyl-prolyl cis-trans isomerase